jgi:hypothetical protein
VRIGGGECCADLHADARGVSGWID